MSRFCRAFWWIDTESSIELFGTDSRDSSGDRVISSKRFSRWESLGPASELVVILDVKLDILELERMRNSVVKSWIPTGEWI